MSRFFRRLGGPVSNPPGCRQAMPLIHLLRKLPGADSLPGSVSSQLTSRRARWRSGTEAAHMAAAVKRANRMVVKSVTKRRHGPRSIEVMRNASDCGHALNHQGGEKAPAEWAVKKSVCGQERESAKPRIPVPSRTKPARPISSVRNIDSGSFHVCLRQIL